MFADLPLHKEKRERRAKPKRKAKNGFWQNVNIKKRVFCADF